MNASADTRDECDSAFWQSKPVWEFNLLEIGTKGISFCLVTDPSIYLFLVHMLKPISDYVFKQARLSLTRHTKTCREELCIPTTPRDHLPI